MSYFSPHPKEARLHPECPNMPVWGLWDYEMIELHFLNDNDEYFDIRDIDNLIWVSLYNAYNQLSWYIQ